MQTGVSQRIIELCNHHNSAIIIPALWTIGNFVTGNDEQTDLVIEQGILEVIGNLMGHEEAMIRREAVWTLSNICAGNPSQIARIIETDILDKLIIIATQDSMEIQREAIWSLSNTTACKHAPIIKVLVEKNIIQTISTWLNKNDSKTLVIILEGIRNILQVGKIQGYLNEFTNIIEVCGGLDMIEALQEYPNQHVYEIAI